MPIYFYLTLGFFFEVFVTSYRLQPASIREIHKIFDMCSCYIHSKSQDFTILSMFFLKLHIMGYIDVHK